MRNNYLELPTNKKRYLLAGIIITSYFGYALTNTSYLEKSILLLSIITISYILSSLNAPLFVVKSYAPNLGKKFREYIKREYGETKETELTNKDVIDTKINLNLGLLVLIFFSIYLITKIDPFEFIILLSISTILSSYCSRLETGIGIIAPIVPIFLLIPASIYLKEEPSYLFFSAATLGTALGSIFATKELKKKNLTAINLGGRGSYESFLVISFLALLLFI